MPRQYQYLKVRLKTGLNTLKRDLQNKPNTTLASVVNNEVSYLGNHVTNFLTERANATNKYDKKSQAK